MHPARSATRSRLPAPTPALLSLLLLLLLLCQLRLGRATAELQCIVVSTWAGSDYVSPNLPNGIGVDATSNVYIADMTMSEIVRIDYNDPEKTARNVVGLAGVRGHKDGVGTDARVGWPGPMVFVPLDSPTFSSSFGGSLFFIDFYSATIRRVTPDRSVKTVAGVPRVAELNIFGVTNLTQKDVDGPAMQAHFAGGPNFIALDTDHDVLYVTEFNCQPETNRPGCEDRSTSRPLPACPPARPRARTLAHPP